MFSALAAGPALIALFNVALRGTRRAIIICAVLSVVGGMVFTVVYRDPNGRRLGRRAALVPDSRA